MTEEEQRKLEALVNRQDLTLNNKGMLPNNISTNIFDGTLDLLGVPKSTRDSIRIDINSLSKQASISVATLDNLV